MLRGGELIPDEAGMSREAVKLEMAWAMHSARSSTSKYPRKFMVYLGEPPQHSPNFPEKDKEDDKKGHSEGLRKGADFSRSISRKKKTELEKTNAIPFG